MQYKSKCNECTHSKKKATQEPCSECSEIQLPIHAKDNYFEAR